MALLDFVFIHSRVLSIHERLVKYMAGHIHEKRNGMSEKIRFVELMDAYGPQVMEIGTLLMELMEQMDRRGGPASLSIEEHSKLLRLWRQHGGRLV